MFSFLTLTHFFIGTAVTSMLGVSWWQCLAAGVIASLPDVPAFTQVGLDILKRRTMFARQSKAMLIAKEAAHSIFLWLLLLFPLCFFYPWHFLLLNAAMVCLAAYAVISDGTKDDSWHMLFLSALIVTVTAIHWTNNYYWVAMPGLFLGLHWIIDLLTHSWDISDNKKVLGIPKQEADVSLTWPARSWLDLKLYDYRPADNGSMEAHSGKKAGNRRALAGHGDHGCEALLKFAPER